MSFAIFHPFSRLPTELRLEIWEEACSPSPGHRRGLHYFAIDEKSTFIPFNWSGAISVMQPIDKPADEPAEQSAEQSAELLAEREPSIGPGNRSAYLSDGGLWTACTESRAVMVKHYQYEEWFQNGLRALRELSIYEASREVPDHPGVVYVQEGNKEWPLLIYPFQDIFCIFTKNWEQDEQCLNVPSVGSDIHTTLVANLALEFDPSWNLDFPPDLNHFKREKSARGFLARMIADLGHWSSDPNVWLIDNNAHWLAKPGQDLGQVFYDCDREYTGIDLDDTYDVPSEGGDESPIAFFIHKLDRLCDLDYDQFQNSYWNPRYDSNFEEYWGRRVSPEESIKILVRRDNQVIGHGIKG